jgi:hypothetical protein
MLLEPRKRQLLERAESLTGQLTRGQVTRAELKPVLNVLFLPGVPWQERLERARRLWDHLPESFVVERSKKSRPQWTQVRSMFQEVFRESFTEEELRFLLGWVSRLVHIHDLKKKQNSDASPEAY